MAAWDRLNFMARTISRATGVRTQAQALQAQQRLATQAAIATARASEGNALAASDLVNVMELILFKLDEILAKMPAPGPPA